MTKVVQVRAADAAHADAHEHLARADLACVPLVEPQVGRRMDDEAEATQTSVIVAPCDRMTRLDPTTLFVALQHRNFRLLWIGLLISFSGSLMQTAALLWHVSLLVPDDKRALALGMVGLVRVVPVVVFSLLSGVAADVLRPAQADAGHAERDGDLRRGAGGDHLARAGFGVAGLCDRGGELRGRRVRPAGAAVAHAEPGAARGPPNALALNTIMFQVAAVIGPGARRDRDRPARRRLGLRPQRRVVPGRHRGAAHDARHDGTRGRRDRGPKEGTKPAFTVHAALEGLRFVFRAPLIRSTMLMDFFATFFSSATALLPLYAQDILGVGASGYGWLYAAPAVGAIVTSAIMVKAVDRIERRGTRADVGGGGLRTGDGRVRPLGAASGCRLAAWR